MSKKGLTLFVVIMLLAFITGCKGTRTVKVVVENAGVWYVHINEDSGATTRVGYATETFDLGNNEANIMVDAWRITANAYNLKDLTIKILEEYDNGFLYTKTSTVKASITNTYIDAPYCSVIPVTTNDENIYKMSNPLAIATVTYDFSPK